MKQFIRLGLRLILLASTVIFMTYCGKKDYLPSIGSVLSEPIDVGVSKDGEYFFVLNSNASQKYATGSIAVLAKDGQKITSIETQRMGRNLLVQGNLLLVTYDHESKAGSTSRLELYDITDPKKPKLKAGQNFSDCSPVNAVMREGYPYIALSCLEGRIYFGEVPAKNKALTLSLVRQYPGAPLFSRRALYLDGKRKLLFLFPTSMAAPQIRDAKFEDSATWNLKGQKVNDTPNDYPDSIEKYKAKRLDIQRWGSPLQFNVYDIAAAEADKAKARSNVYLYKENKDVQEEFRWMYFSLTNFDGTPDDQEQYTNKNEKYYRTNFWNAKPDLEDENSFYLSHRGLGELLSSPGANSVIKVTLVGDPRKLGKDSDGNVIPPITKDYMSFKRVYGFKGNDQNPDYSFVGDFSMTKISGQKVMIVNHFRDSVSFTQPYFALYGMTLDDNSWTDKVESTGKASANIDNYFQVAAANNGYVLTCSFYSNAVVLFKFNPGNSITKMKTIH